MPVRKVGADCWQWGKSGKVYCGPNAKQKAHAQERAAYANGFRESKKQVSAAESNDDMQYLLDEIKRTWHSNYNQITEYVEHTMAGDGLIAYWNMFDLPNGEQIDENTTKEEYFEKMFQSFYERFAANAQVSTDERGLEVVGHRILYVPVGTKINTESLGNWENRKADRYGVFDNPITSWLWSDDIYTGVIFGDDSIDHMEGIEGKDFDRIVLAAWIGWEAVDWASTIAFNISGFWQECELCVFDKATVYDLDIYRNGKEEAILEKAMNAESESKKPDSVKIRPSEKGDKSKYTAVFYQDENKIKTTHFGWRGMSDFTKHKDPERKQRYLDRHKKNENWKDPMSAGALSRWILWNKPTLTASKKDYAKKFNIDLAAEDTLEDYFAAEWWSWYSQPDYKPTRYTYRIYTGVPGTDKENVLPTEYRTLDDAVEELLNYVEFDTSIPYIGVYEVTSGSQPKIINEIYYRAGKFGGSNKKVLADVIERAERRWNYGLRIDEPDDFLIGATDLGDIISEVFANEGSRPAQTKCDICKSKEEVYTCRLCGRDSCAKHYRKDFRSCLPCFSYMKNYMAEEKKYPIRFMDPHRRLKRLIKDQDVDPLEAARKISFSSDEE